MARWADSHEQLADLQCGWSKLEFAERDQCSLEPVFVNLLAGAQESIPSLAGHYDNPIDVPAREAISTVDWWNRFLGSLNVYKYGLSSSETLIGYKSGKTSYVPLWNPLVRARSSASELHYAYFRIHGIMESLSGYELGSLTHFSADMAVYLYEIDESA